VPVTGRPTDGRGPSYTAGLWPVGRHVGCAAPAAPTSLLRGGLDAAIHLEDSRCVHLSATGELLMSEISTRSDIEVAHDLATRDFRLMENWDDAEASAIIPPTMHNARQAASN
jgi:hypothetical protein